MSYEYCVNTQRLHTDRLIWVGHELLNKAFLYTLLALGANHIAASFVEGVNLLGS